MKVDVVDTDGATNVVGVIFLWPEIGYNSAICDVMPPLRRDVSFVDELQGVGASGSARESLRESANFFAVGCGPCCAVFWAGNEMSALHELSGVFVKHHYLGVGREVELHCLTCREVWVLQLEECQDGLLCNRPGFDTCIECWGQSWSPTRR